MDGAHPWTRRAFSLLTFLYRLQVIPNSPTFTEWAETPDGSAIQLTPASAGPHRLLFWQIPSAGYTTLVGRLSSSSGGRIGLSARTSQDGSTAVDVVLDISADGQTATPSVCVGATCTAVGAGTPRLLSTSGD